MSIKLMSQVFEAAFKSPTEKLVMLVLADKANDEGQNIFPSVATIARMASLSDRAVQLTLKKLIDSGCLKQDGTYKSSHGPVNRYSILVDKLPTGERHSPVNVIHPTGERHSPTGERRSPNPSLTTNKPNSLSATPTHFASEASDSSPANSTQMKLAATLGKPITPFATKQILEKCSDLKRLEAVVNYCRTEGYGVTTMLSIYDEWPTHRHNPEARRAAAGAPKRNQAGTQSKRQTFRRDQCPPREGIQSEIAALQRNAKNKRDRGDLAGAERMEAAARKLAAQGATA
jgi:hypothetical protein